MRCLDVPSFIRITEAQRDAISEWLTEHGFYDVREVEEQWDGALRITYLMRGVDGRFITTGNGEPAETASYRWADEITRPFPWPEES